ncbi:MAG TPA: Gfo/Idh/MocA family oxidoreductase [Bacillales bacterium]|nr:Gfo/Idh/MocA family oxidoreductase [Bacillales bacterium]
MTNQVHWGILGNAGIARKALIPAIQRADNAKLYAIASASSNVEQAAREYGAEQAYTNYEALLEDPEVDAVYIPLPNGLHAEWVKKAAAAGKHVLCEKPAALTAAEAADMVTACERSHVLFMEAFMYRFHPQHEKVRALIAEGAIGEVRTMRSRFSFTLNDAANNIRTNPELGGGALYDVGCYCIHASRYMLGSEPTHVYAQARIDGRFGVDMTTSGLLTFANGVQAAFDCSFEAPDEEFYEVVGSEGRIYVERPFRPDKTDDGNGRIVVNGETHVIEGDAYKAQVEHFSRCVLEQTEPVHPGAETVRNMQVIDACREAMRTGNAVSVSR